MANLEINMPDDLHERLRRIAGADDGAAAGFAITVIQREVEWLEWKERWAQAEPDQNGGKERRELTMAEWQARRRNRPVLDLDFDAAAAIREERQRREQEWDRYMKSRQKNTS